MNNKKFDFKSLAILGIASGAILVSQVGEAAPTNNEKNNQGVYLAGNSCGNGSCNGVPTTNRNTQDTQRNQKEANPHAQPSYPANYSQSSFQYKNNNSLTALNDGTEEDLSKKTKIAPSKPITSTKKSATPSKSTNSPFSNKSNVNKQNLSKRTQSQTNSKVQRPLALADDKASDSLPKSAKEINTTNTWNKNSQSTYPKPNSSNLNYYKNSATDDDDDDYDDEEEDDDDDDVEEAKGSVKGSVPMPASKSQSAFQKSSYSRNTNRNQPSLRQTAMNDNRDEDIDSEDNNDYNSSYRSQRNTRSNSLYNRNNYRNTTR